MDRNNTTNILLKGIVILIVPAIAIVALGKIGLTEAQTILIVGVFTVITAAQVQHRTAIPSAGLA